MPQNAGAAFVAQNPSNFLAPLRTDTVGALSTGVGTKSKLNVVAAVVVKTGAGRVGTVVNLAGVAGFTINDCATTGAASAANQLYLISTTTVGQVLKLDLPFTVGLTISAVGSSGQLALSYD